MGKKSHLKEIRRLLRQPGDLPQKKSPASQQEDTINDFEQEEFRLLREEIELDYDKDPFYNLKFEDFQELRKIYGSPLMYIWDAEREGREWEAYKRRNEVHNKAMEIQFMRLHREGKTL